MNAPLNRRDALAVLGSGAAAVGVVTAADLSAAVSALAPPAAELADNPDFGPLTSEIIRLAQKTRESTFALARLAVLADQHENGGPAEPFIEACAEYAADPNYGAYTVARLGADTVGRREMIKRRALPS